MAAEEGDEDELEDGEHPGVEHLLEALHVPAIYGRVCDTSAREPGGGERRGEDNASAVVQSGVPTRMGGSVRTLR